MTVTDCDADDVAVGATGAVACSAAENDAALADCDVSAEPAPPDAEPVPAFASDDDPPSLPSSDAVCATVAAMPAPSAPALAPAPTPVSVSTLARVAAATGGTALAAPGLTGADAEDVAGTADESAVAASTCGMTTDACVAGTVGGAAAGATVVPTTPASVPAAPTIGGVAGDCAVTTIVDAPGPAGVAGIADPAGFGGTAGPADFSADGAPASASVRAALALSSVVVPASLDVVRPPPAEPVDAFARAGSGCGEFATVVAGPELPFATAAPCDRIDPSPAVSARPSASARRRDADADETAAPADVCERDDGAAC